MYALRAALVLHNPRVFLRLQMILNARKEFKPLFSDCKTNYRECERREKKGRLIKRGYYYNKTVSPVQSSHNQFLMFGPV
jgi:hypothetical protein